MFELDIKSSQENYKVSIGVSIEDYLDGFDFLIIDENLRARFSSSNSKMLFVEASEEKKTLSTVELICETLRLAGVRRSSKILAIGGGVIQDLATLAASLFMRGVSWSYAPTTLTGILDSCLGGKSSINVRGTKNLVGNIYPPNQILIDPTFIQTLAIESVVSGLAEGVKISFAKGTVEFERFLESRASQLNSSEDFETLIFETLKNKKWFIEVDEYDKAERQLLNFGHSFGHAIETAVDFQIQHGTAVALGMVAAIGHPDSARSIWTKKLEEYCVSLLAPLEDKLNQAAANLSEEKFKEALRSDKKNTSDSLCLILPGSTTALNKVYLPFDTGSVDVAYASVVRTFSRFTKTKS
jgi:3-dehydroquinate synthase